MVEASPCKVPGPSILKSSKNMKAKNETVDDNDPASEPLIKRKDDSSHKLGNDLKKHGNKSNEMKNNDSFSRPLLLESPEFQRKDFGVSTDQSLGGIQMKVAGEHTKETCQLVHKENLQKVAEISQLRNTCISSFSLLCEQSKSNLVDETINNTSDSDTALGGITKSQNKIFTKPAVVDVSSKQNDIKISIGSHGSVNPVPMHVAKVEIEEGILHAAQKLATLPQQKNMLNDVCSKTSGTSNRRCVDGATIFTIAKMGVKQDDSTKACQSIASPISSFSEKNEIILNKMNDSKTPSSSAMSPVVNTATPVKPFQASNITKINPSNIICSTPKTSYQHSPYIFKDEKPPINKQIDNIAGSTSKEVLQSILAVSNTPRDLTYKNDKSKSLHLGEIKLKSANQSQEKKSPDSIKDNKSISSELKLSISAIKSTMANKSDIVKAVPDIKSKIETSKGKESQQPSNSIIQGDSKSSKPIETSKGKESQQPSNSITQGDSKSSKPIETSKGKESQQPPNSITQGDSKSSKPISNIQSISTDANRLPEATSVSPSISKSVDDKAKKSEETEKQSLKSSISKSDQSEIRKSTEPTKQSEKPTSAKTEIVQSVLEKSKLSENMQVKGFNCNPSNQILNKQTSNIANVTNTVSKEMKTELLPLSATNKLITESKKVESSVSLTKSESKPTQSVPLAATSKVIDSKNIETIVPPSLEQNDQKKGEPKGLTKDITKPENKPAQSVTLTAATKLIDNKKVDSTVTPSLEKKENKSLVSPKASSKLIDHQNSGKSKGNIDLTKPAQAVPITLTSKLLADPKKSEPSEIKGFAKTEMKPTNSVSLTSTSKTNTDPIRAEPKSVTTNLPKTEIKSPQPVSINVTSTVIADPKKVESTLYETKSIAKTEIKPTNSVSFISMSKTNVDPMRAEPKSVTTNLPKTEIKSPQPVSINVTSKVIADPKKVEPSSAKTEKQPIPTSETNKPIVDTKKGESSKVATVSSKIEIKPTAISKLITEPKKIDVIPNLTKSEPKPVVSSGTGKLITDSKKGKSNNVVPSLSKSEIKPAPSVSPASSKSMTDQKKLSSTVSTNLPKAESKAKQEIPPTAAVKMILDQSKGEPIVIITDSAKPGNKNDHTVGHSSAKATAEPKKADLSKPQNAAASNQSDKSASNKSSSNVDTENPSENTKKTPSVTKSVVKLK